MWCGLSIEDLASVIGSRDWKGFVLGQELKLGFMSKVDEESLKERLEIGVRRRLTMDVEEQFVDGEDGNHAKLWILTFSPSVGGV